MLIRREFWPWSGSTQRSRSTDEVRTAASPLRERLTPYFQVQHRSTTSNATRLVARIYKDTTSIANGKFNIRTTKCKTETDRNSSFVSVVVTFTADESQYRQFILSMHFFKRCGNDGSNVLPPCIIAHAVIPDDSLTIQVVRNGNLTEFKQLLENGQARVWDCDSEGRSLLNVSLSRCGD